MPSGSRPAAAAVLEERRPRAVEEAAGTKAGTKADTREARDATMQSSRRTAVWAR